MGDFVEKFSRTEAGIATVEGQVSGARAAMLSVSWKRSRGLEGQSASTIKRGGDVIS